jgi:hypothetical protein
MNAGVPSEECGSDDGSVDSLLLALARVPSLGLEPLAVDGLAAGTARSAPLLGRVLGRRYELLELLGRGGMGTVYAARNLRTGREVAVKVLQPGMQLGASRREREARFTREARAAGRVRHPNVVDVYDVDVDGDLFYLVMERLYGESLRACIARGPLAPRAAVAILLDAMRGVAAAHRQGVIHRDLKPDNIFVARPPDGSPGLPQVAVKVLDFGVSRIVENDQPEPSPLTGEGQVLGTVSYMPPEQLRGDGCVDARSDVYALGVILYEAVSGVRPYQGRSERELLARLFSEPPPSLRTKAPAADALLDALTMRALARDPAERFASVESFAEALTGWLEGGEAARAVPARSAPQARLGRRGGVLAVGLALCALGSAWWVASHAQPAREQPAPAARGRAPAVALPSAQRAAAASSVPPDPVRPAVGLAAPRAAAASAPRVRVRRSAGPARPGAARPTAEAAPVDATVRETLLLRSDF